MERLLNTAEVAGLIGVPVQTLYRWRWEKKGPAGFRAGRGLRYRASDVEAWIDEQISAEAS